MRAHESISVCMDLCVSVHVCVVCACGEGGRVCVCVCVCVVGGEREGGLMGINGNIDVLWLRWLPIVLFVFYNYLISLSLLPIVTHVS